MGNSFKTSNLSIAEIDLLTALGTPARPRIPNPIFAVYTSPARHLPCDKEKRADSFEYKLDVSGAAFAVRPMACGDGQFLRLDPGRV